MMNNLSNNRIYDSISPIINKIRDKTPMNNRTIDKKYQYFV